MTRTIRVIRACENGNCPDIRLLDNGGALVRGYEPNGPQLPDREITTYIPPEAWQRLMAQLP